MTTDNPFTRILKAHADAAPDERRRKVTEAIGNTIPFVRTAGLTIDTYTPTRVVAHLANQPHVQNHIGGMHAAAMALLAETVTGLVVALNVPDESVPVIRELDVSYQRQAQGALRAEARIPDEEAHRIRTAPIGKIEVPVEIRDASDQSPIACAMHWAWIPSNRLQRSAT
jgi:acyl-coenzyme A thioesterase PaaI-like protein